MGDEQDDWGRVYKSNHKEERSKELVIISLLEKKTQQ